MNENYTRVHADAKLEAALDALFTLTAACGVGHIRWTEGTRGHRQALHALKQARDVLRQSKYRVEAAELAMPAPVAAGDDAALERGAQS